MTSPTEDERPVVITTPPEGVTLTPIQRVRPTEEESADD